MKIIPLYSDQKIQQLILEIQRGDTHAQKVVYEQYAPKMLSVCRMYVKDLQFAEDCMIKGFVKVFRNVKQFQHKGSFEGWIRRIMVNECLTYLRFHKKISLTAEEEFEEPSTTIPDFGFKAQNLIDQLPEGYKVVFNLFVMEEMSHKEIASQLGISESSSKSQLFKAKQKLKAMFRNNKQMYL